MVESQSGGRDSRYPVRRRVALKVIKLGMDSKQVLARFELERRALAVMNHPAIAKVFDASITEQGQPYFVMERIDVPSCNFGGSPSKNPDIAASHGPSMMRDPAWNRLVLGVIS